MKEPSIKGRLMRLPYKRHSIEPYLDEMGLGEGLGGSFGRLTFLGV